MRIHPTAIVHPEAEIAGDAEIGPWVCIEGPARVGPGCKILAHAVLSGRVEMGAGNVVCHGAILGGLPQDLSFDPGTHSGVLIGNDNVIRELCTIHRGSKEGAHTRLGDGNFLMAGAHLGHDVDIGNRCIIANNALLGGHVKVGDNVFIGGGCVFHQFIRIGSFALTQGASAFSKDVPPFTLAAERNGIAALNVIGLRRAGFTATEREEIKRAFDLLYRSGLNVSQALERAREIDWGPHGRAFFDFVADAKRKGLCDLLASRSGGAED